MTLVDKIRKDKIKIFSKGLAGLARGVSMTGLSVKPRLRALILRLGPSRIFRAFHKALSSSNLASPRLLVLLGNVLEIEGRFDQTVSHYRRALTRHPRALDLHLAYDRALIQTGAFEAANEAFLHLHSLFPNSPAPLIALARTAESTEEFELECGRWRQLCAWFPDNGTCYIGLISCLAKMQQIDEAEAVFQRHQARFPTAAFQILQAIIFQAQECHQAALVEYERLARDFPHTNAIELGIATCLSETGHYQQAEQHLESLRALPAFNTRNIDAQLAENARRARRYQIAADRWQALSQAHPQIGYFHSRHIDALLSLADIDKARAQYESVRNRHPHPRFRYNYLVKILHAENQIPQALEAIEAAIEAGKRGKLPVQDQAFLLKKKAALLGPVDIQDSQAG